MAPVGCGFRLEERDLLCVSLFVLLCTFCSKTSVQLCTKNELLVVSNICIITTAQNYLIQFVRWRLVVKRGGWRSP